MRIKRPVRWRLLILLIACCGLGCPEPPTPRGHDTAFPAPTEPMGLARPVGICEREPPDFGDARAQLLLDASGSMVGFDREAVIRRVVDWVNRTARGRHPRLEQVAIFNMASGIRRIDSRRLDYRVGSDTNLPDAIRQAQKAELTFLLTDGIPYDHEGGGGDCARGTDQGCVALRLRELVNEYVRPGIWVVPMVARYSGKLYTEGQELPPASEYRLRDVKEDIETIFPGWRGIELERRQATSPRDAPLAYTGPKLLLLFVLAHEDRLGRAMVDALVQQTTQFDSPVRWLAESFDAVREDSPVGVMAPVEVLPGKLPTVETVELTAGRNEGTIGLREDLREGNPASVALACGEGAGTLPLTAELRPATGRGGVCSNAFMLPGFVVSVSPSPPELKARLEEMLTTASIRSGEGIGFGLDLGLECGPGAGLPCGGAERGAVAIEYAIHHEPALRALANRESWGAVDYVHRLSTISLPREPFKVLGFDAMLIAFLEELAEGEKEWKRLATLEICK